MCGILFTNDPEIERDSFLKALDEINHRGPDAPGGYGSSGNNQLGHNRLKIIDIDDRSNQPFTSSNGYYDIIFNGEIYNFKEIKKELSAKNIFFKSNTDTEVILESYKYWGIDFIKRLRGMFAFAMWDLKKRKLILARDPFGIKPLYFSKKNGICYFASQVKSLLSINDIDASYSDAGLVGYYLWGNI